MGLPRKLKTCVACFPSRLRTSTTASALSGTGIALRALAWSACTHANRRTKSTCDHRNPVTFDARNPVEREKAAISAKCSGRAANNRCASSRVRKRIRRVGSFSMRICGARSSHSQSLTLLRRMARNNSSVRFTVALLKPCASFASVILSTSVRLMLSSVLPPRNGSSHRSLATSSPAVALCDCSLSQRTTASFQVRRGFSRQVADPPQLRLQPIVILLR